MDVAVAIQVVEELFGILKQLFFGGLSLEIEVVVESIQQLERAQDLR